MTTFTRTISLLFILCSTASAQLQTELSSFVYSLEMRTQTDTTRISQWVSPVRLRLPAPRGHIAINTAFMFIHQTNIVNDITSNLLDTQITGHFGLGQRALLSLHASLPTGKRALNTTDANLAGILSRNDLNFPIRTFGQGFDFGGTLSVAKHTGHWSLSAGLSVTRKGAYSPIQGVSNYKPGDEISGLIGADYTYRNWIFQINAAGTFYRIDRIDNVIAFRHGKQFLLQTGMHYAGRIFRFKAEITEIARLKNVNTSNGRPLYEMRNSNGNDLRARLEASLSPVPAITLFATGYAKHLTSNAHPKGTPLYQGSAHLLEGGGGILLYFGRTYLTLRTTYLSGRAEDSTVNLSALNVRAALALAL